MGYLIFASRTSAEVRSQAAYVAATPGLPSNDLVTTALWGVIDHRQDGRAALVVPATPEEAALGLSQQDYDGLLTGEERAQVKAELEQGWTATR